MASPASTKFTPESSGPEHGPSFLGKLLSRWPKTDPIEDRLVQAMDLMEGVLLPVLGGDRQPAIGIGSAINAVA